MISQEFIQNFVDLLVKFASTSLLPTLALGFLVAVGLKVLIYLTVKREHWFVNEFEKRVHRYLEDHHGEHKLSFYVSLKKLLEKTFYEVFLVRSYKKRRKPDTIMDINDRLFLVKDGVAFIVKDTLKQSRYLNKGGDHPKFLEISKSVIQNNPCFNRALGIIPSSQVNEILNILPGIFIVGGIFGTFLGIMKGLPDLSGMNLEDIEGTKLIMDNFLLKISFSMSTSIVGIILSVCMSFINAIFSPERIYISIVEKYENSMDMIWNLCETNCLPSEIGEFDENRDPLDALAEENMAKALEKSRYHKYRYNTGVDFKEDQSTVKEMSEKIKNNNGNTSDDDVA
jgi:hypothetical protein